MSRDVSQTGNRTAGANAEAVAIVPRAQEEYRSYTIALRTAGASSQQASVLRSEVQAMDVDLAPADIGTFEERLSRARWPYVVFGTVFGSFAAAALLMAGIGLYAVVSQATERRTREIGIRIALARRASLVAPVIALTHVTK